MPTETPLAEVIEPTEAIDTQPTDLLPTIEVLPTETPLAEVIEPTEAIDTQPTDLLPTIEVLPTETPLADGTEPTATAESAEITPTVEVSPTLTEAEATAAAELTLTPAEDVTPTETLEATGAVSGAVFNALGSPMPIELRLLQVETDDLLATTTDETGAFSFEDLAPGDYVLEAGAEGYISKQMSFTLADGEALELPQTQLSGGDLDNNNKIDLDDLVLIAANYDGPALVAEADVNNDDWIDISDMAIVGSQFGVVGPLPWSTDS